MTETTETAPATPDPLGDEHEVRFTSVRGQKPVLTIDGHDVSRQVSGVQIVADAVSGTRVALEVPPHRLDDVEFAGIARVTIDVFADNPGPAAVVFLSAMDPETVEKQALNRLDLENVPGGSTAAIIRTLIDYAEGTLR